MQSPLRLFTSLATLGIGLAIPSIVEAIPVFPGAQGYGTETPAGRGGKVIKVTSLAASGPGTLAACVQESGPRVCVFEVSGAIELTESLGIAEPFLTIAGETAPSPGIEIRGGTFIVYTHDVLVRHLRVRIGDGPGDDPSNRDGIGMQTGTPDGIYNVVIDHCSVSWAIDENVQLWGSEEGTLRDITISNVISAYALTHSLHKKGRHGMGMIIGKNASRIAVHHNLMANNMDRNPLLGQSDRVVVLNNFIYNTDPWIGNAIHFSATGGEQRFQAIGNVFMPGPDSGQKQNIIVIEPLAAGSQVYVEDNVAPALNGDPWSVVVNQDDDSIKAAAPVLTDHGVTIMPSAAVKDHVLACAGARPLDRDSVDKAAVQSVLDDTGQLINCVEDDGSERCAKNAGGWPDIAENVHTLQIPGDPSGDAGNGYTNLEVWLHDLAAELECDDAAGSGGAYGNGGADGSGGADGGGAAAGSGGTAGIGGSGNAPSGASDGDADGCGCWAAPGEGPPRTGLALGLLLALGLFRRRVGPRT